MANFDKVSRPRRAQEGRVADVFVAGQAIRRRFHAALL